MNFPYGHLSYNRKAKIVKWIVKSHLAFVQKKHSHNSACQKAILRDIFLNFGSWSIVMIAKQQEKPLMGLRQKASNLAVFP